ncbi:sigma-54 dependent transcriptional regulator [Saccharospirillum salsuginis]|uniref:Sigma-54-dependent Fis family transcriptional regulator n=1 Tax=Saccharospirillum salsuginis TaxID=418750 RepID=A0A918N8D5_9GAMM|nr:sigma-54 dependent transcriptional regulator [Saccharospirillum salsuginis]GGX50656.1 sigma-54-dependent Fis family transcriptional regulator [Saccharospirillum salsuginis]
MWREIKLLLIEDDEQRRREFKVILDFLGEVSVNLSSTDWRSQAEQEVESPGELVAVLIGNTEPSLARMVQSVVDWDEGLPIILLDEHPDAELLDDEFRRQIIAKLALPLTYNKLLDTLHRAQMYREQFDLTRGRGQRREVNLFRSLVGSSRGVQQVREMMTQVADKEVTVLIQGESGTGKEVVARNLHYNSHRRHKPFVPVNCGAIPGELIESELFGHEKGAFTGAITARAGRFEMAEGGTLFLDEIGDLPLAMQVKLLRVLQERTFERVGGNKTFTCDLRVIAATHRNLEQMIEDGTFREDLYYRLNVFPIEMPPLRERAEDIPLLLNELIARLENEKRGSIRFNSGAIMSLVRHDWPGNVREMANLVERLAIMHPYGVIGVQELPLKYRHVDDDDESLMPTQVPSMPMQDNMPAFPQDQQALLPVNGLDLKEYLTDLEKSLIQQALDDAQGVVARAAEKLHIRRTTLVEKMRKYKINKREAVS